MKEIFVFLRDKKVKYWNFGEVENQFLKQNLPKEYSYKICDSTENFLKELPNAEIVLVWFFKDEWLELAPNLKWVATPSAGKEYIGREVQNNIKVTFGTFHGQIMSETLLGMILFSCRRLGFWTGVKRTELLWPRTEIESGLSNLRGAHVVILGFGAIAEHSAKLLKAFGARITGVKRKIIDSPEYFDEADKIISLNEIENVLPTADHFVCLLPGEKENQKIINKKLLSLLPRNTWFYNLGRGNVVDEEALIECLDSKSISGAFLDVFDEEPLAPESKLRTLENVHILPHSSAIAPNYLTLFLREFLRDLKKGN